MASTPLSLQTRRTLLLAAVAGVGGMRRAVAADDGVASPLAPMAPLAAPAASAASAAPPAPPAPPAPILGRVESLTIASRRTGVAYPVRLYRPPGDRDDDAEPLPIAYLLDAEWRLDTLAHIAEATGRRIRIAGIANEATRNHDDVPANACIAGGGGNAEFLGFITDELLPFVEARIAVDPGRRLLVGHSFGGALVLYALFSEPPGRHRFSAYLAADPAIRCIGDSAAVWEDGYAAAVQAGAAAVSKGGAAAPNDRLPVRLHFSYANPVAAPFAERIARRAYPDLRFASRAYAGGHDGMIPAAFADALDFALA